MKCLKIMMLTGAVLMCRGARATEWRAYAANEAGNPTTNTTCIVSADGQWVFTYTWRTSDLKNGTLAPTLWSAAADGILDMRDMVINGTTNITSFIIGGSTFRGSSQNMNSIVEVYVNHVTSWSGDVFRGCSKLCKAYLEGETVTDFSSFNAFLSCSSLTNLVVNMPNMKKFGPSLVYSPLTNDVHEIFPSSVTSYNCGGWEGTGVTGTMILTNLTSLSTSVHGQGIPRGVTNVYLVLYQRSLPDQMFRPAARLGDATLILPNVTNAATAFLASEQSSISNLTLYAPNLTLISSACPALKKLTIMNPPFATTNVMPKLVTCAAVASSQNKDKNMRIYCSKAQGWRAYAAPLEGQYEPQYAPAKCFGVYTNAAGRLAWLVHQPMAGDPVGTVLCFR